MVHVSEELFSVEEADYPVLTLLLHLLDHLLEILGANLLKEGDLLAGVWEYLIGL